MQIINQQIIYFLRKFKQNQLCLYYIFRRVMKLRSLIIRIQNFLKIKKYRISDPYYIPIYLSIGGLAYFTISVIKALMNKSQVFITQATKQFTKLYIPVFMRQYIYSIYVNKYGVNLDQAQLQLEQYNNFSEFFTRKIKKRPYIDEQLSNNKSICCPCDSEILNISRIVDNKNIIVKDIPYSLNSFIFQLKQQDQSKKIVQDLCLNSDSQLYQAIFYLSPADYHRFHSPTNMTVQVFRNIQGAVRPVNIKSIIQNGGIVYEKNARKILHCNFTNILNLKRYYLGFVMVGAMNVSDIVINQKKMYNKGDQIGYFNLGSTIVMIMQLPKGIKWNKKVGDKVKYGERLCQFL